MHRKMLYYQIGKFSLTDNIRFDLFEGRILETTWMYEAHSDRQKALAILIINSKATRIAMILPYDHDRITSRPME
ncbi:MAG: hypothetical protein ACXQTE_04130 [Methanosarcinaceae archaeon]